MYRNQTYRASPDCLKCALALIVYEAWASQRPGGIIVMIEEVYGKPIKAGQSFSAAHIVGFFDDIEGMHQVYDRHKGNTKLSVDGEGWKLGK